MHEQTAEKLVSLGIKSVIFDLDDTLIKTGDIFESQMTEYALTMAKISGHSEELIYRRLEEVNNEEYENHRVSVEKWHHVVLRLTEEFQNEEFFNNLPILMKIYKKEPVVYTGARELLKQLGISGFRVGVVTHANEDWTYWKLRRTGLIDLVGAVVVADEYGLKTKAHWHMGMEILGVTAQESLVVGDNLRGDVWPARELGARAMLLPAAWSLYAQGEVPEGVVKLGSIGEFNEGVKRLI